MKEEQKNKLKELRDKKASGETLDSSEQSLLDALESIEEAEAATARQRDEFEEKVSGLQSGLDSLRTKFSDTEKKLKDLKDEAGQQKSGEQGKQTTDDKAEEAAQKKADANALQKKLASSEEGKKLLDDAWKQMSPSDRHKMSTDDDFRLSVYRYAESELPEPEPKPPWEQSGGQSENEEHDVSKFFNNENNKRRAPSRRESSAKERDKEDVYDPNYSEEGLVIDSRTR